jgi:hypothetical protein
MHVDLSTLEAGIGEIRRSPGDVGTVELIVRRPAENEREMLGEARLDTGEGLVGDGWLARDGDVWRQVTVMNARSVALLAGSRDRWPLAGDQLYVDFDLSAENPATRGPSRGRDSNPRSERQAAPWMQEVLGAIRARCAAVRELEDGICLEPARHQHPGRPVRRRSPW